MIGQRRHHARRCSIPCRVITQAVAADAGVEVDDEARVFFSRAARAGRSFGRLHAELARRRRSARSTRAFGQNAAAASKRSNCGSVKRGVFRRALLDAHLAGRTTPPWPVTGSELPYDSAPTLLGQQLADDVVEQEAAAGFAGVVLQIPSAPALADGVPGPHRLRVHAVDQPDLSLHAAVDAARSTTQSSSARPSVGRGLPVHEQAVLGCVIWRSHAFCEPQE